MCWRGSDSSTFASVKPSASTSSFAPATVLLCSKRIGIDGSSYRNLQNVERDVRIFLVIARAALEPIGALPPHDRHEPSSADRMGVRRLRGERPRQGARDNRRGDRREPQKPWKTLRALR